MGSKDKHRERSKRREEEDGRPAAKTININPSGYHADDENHSTKARRSNRDNDDAKVEVSKVHHRHSDEKLHRKGKLVEREEKEVKEDVEVEGSSSDTTASSAVSKKPSRSHKKEIKVETEASSSSEEEEEAEDSSSEEEEAEDSSSEEEEEEADDGTEDAEEEEGEEGSETTDELIAAEPLYQILEKFFMSENGRNIADILEEVLEKLKYIKYKQ